MRNGKTVGLVIPTQNEEAAIGKVLADVPNWVDTIVVADNGSLDRTVEVATEAGAKTATGFSGEYGAACLAGIATLPDHDIIVFIDGDYSDYPQQMNRIVDPIAEGKADMVIGSRRLGHCENGSLTLPQRFGNVLACFLIERIWKFRYTDLGPFRAIAVPSLTRLDMKDKAFGWTVEMQIRALQEGLRIKEVPVDYRARIGHSKISGTIKGTFLAGYAILGTIFRLSLHRR
ncbi:MAG: glycosyltransferase family 2 protein [Rhizobiaceae bacterium]|nr:glycosyltransferase family 2 protein [Rhizobiaceae bacterium]